MLLLQIDYRIRKLQAMEGNDIHPLNSMNERCMRYFQRAMNKTFTRQKGFPWWISWWKINPITWKISSTKKKRIGVMHANSYEAKQGSAFVQWSVQRCMQSLSVGSQFGTICNRKLDLSLEIYVNSMKKKGYNMVVCIPENLTSLSSWDFICHFVFLSLFSLSGTALCI